MASPGGRVAPTRPSRIFIGAAVVALALTGMTACNRSQEPEPVPIADYLQYTTSAEGVARADLIVTGDYLDSRPDTLYPSEVDSDDPTLNPQAGVPEADLNLDDAGVPITVSRIRVAEVLKGDAAPGDVIEVQEVRGTELLATAQDGHTDAPLLLLLSSWPYTPHGLINPTQGLMLVVDGDATSVSEGGFPSLPLAEYRQLAATEPSS